MADLKMLAIDLGASSGRGIVGSFDGEKITLRENHRFSNDPVFVNGRFTWDILRIFFEIKNSITKTVIDGDDVSSMGIDTWGVDYGLLDRNGRLMANPTHYRDTRTVGISDYVSRFVSAEEIYKVTGIQAIDFNTLNQLAAEGRDDPDMLARAEQMLFIRALEAAADCALLAGQDGSRYAAHAERLSKKLDRQAGYRVHHCLHRHAAGCRQARFCV